MVNVSGLPTQVVITAALRGDYLEAHAKISAGNPSLITGTLENPKYYLKSILFNPNYIYVTFNNTRIHSPQNRNHDQFGPVLRPTNSFYGFDFTRKGILTAVYDQIELLSHQERFIRVVPSLSQMSSDSKKFWRNRIMKLRSDPADQKVYDQYLEKLSLIF